MCVFVTFKQMFLWAMNQEVLKATTFSQFDIFQYSILYGMYIKKKLNHERLEL